MTATALLAALLLSTSAPAKAAEARAELKLRQGLTEFNRGNFGAALKALEAGLKEASSEGLGSRLHLLRAQCFAAQQDMSRAEEALGEAVRLDPLANLDPGKVDPALVRQLESLRARLKGTLKVRTPEDGADVLIDGAKAGRTPYEADLPIGRHKVTVRLLDGSLQAETDAVVRMDAVTELSLIPNQPVPEDGKRVLWPFADLRGVVAAPPAAFGFELGGGVKSRFLRASAHAQMFPRFGLNFRGGLAVPLVNRLDVYAQLELLSDFGGPVTVAVGGGGGAEYRVVQWVGLFAEVGARHYFSGGTNGFAAQLGTRLWLP